MQVGPEAQAGKAGLCPSHKLVLPSAAHLRSMQLLLCSAVRVLPSLVPSWRQSCQLYSRQVTADLFDSSLSAAAAVLHHLPVSCPSPTYTPILDLLDLLVPTFCNRGSAPLRRKEKKKRAAIKVFRMFNDQNLTQNQMHNESEMFLVAHSWA